MNYQYLEMGQFSNASIYLKNVLADAHMADKNKM
jgi:hypothetical protein